MSSGDDGSAIGRPSPALPLNVLSSRALFVPLTGDTSAPFVVLALPDGRRALPIFTSRAALERAATTHALQDRMGELRPGEAPGRLALGHVARAGLDAAVVDLGAPTSYVVARADIDALLAGSQRPPSGAFQTVRRPSPPLPAAERIRVLVVDDDPTILMMVQRYLASRGAEVEVSSAALGVSGLVARHRPSVLVLDVSMPALDGAQIAALLRSAVQAPAIVFYSAIDTPRLEALSASFPGAQGVPKTAGLEALWEAVRRGHRARPR